MERRRIKARRWMIDLGSLADTIPIASHRSSPALQPFVSPGTRLCKGGKWPGQLDSIGCLMMRKSHIDEDMPAGKRINRSSSFVGRRRPVGVVGD